jgi:hypothetical protein
MLLLCTSSSGAANALGDRLFDQAFAQADPQIAG